MRRAALLAAGQVPVPRLWPAVIAALGEPGTARAAARALTTGGVAALTAMANAAALAPGATCAALLRIAGRLGPAAIPFLRDHLGDADDAARANALGDLARLGYRATGAEADLVRRLLRDEVAAATSLTQAQVDLAPLGGADEAVALLGRALERALRGHQVRACLLLALLHDAATLLGVEAALGDNSAERRVYAQEMLIVTVAPELRRLALPLFADLAPAQRLQRLAAAFPQRALAALDRLAALVAPAVPTGDPWLRTCALAAAAHGGAQLIPGVVAALEDRSPWSARRRCAPSRDWID